MLHTCTHCGEAWSAEHVLLHLDEFEFAPDDNRATLTGCPCCLDDLPGIPGVSTNRRLATSRLVRLADRDWLEVETWRHFTSPLEWSWLARVQRAVRVAGCSSARGCGIEVVV